MSILKWVVAGLALLPISAALALDMNAPPGSLPAVQAPQQTPEQAEVAALTKQYSEAMAEYQKPLMEAKTAEERSKIQLDPARHPAHQFYPKFRDLATKLGKNDAALQAWVLARSTATVIGDTAGADAALEAMFKNFVNSDAFAPTVGRLVTLVRGETPEQNAARWEAVLARVERESTNSEVLAAVLARRSALHSQDQAKVAEIQKTLIAKYPNTAAGKRAKAAIFEAKNLVVGKVAPDFTATDVDGKSFKLSDYRGKVVVLEFWGFW